MFYDFTAVEWDDLAADCFSRELFSAAVNIFKQSLKSLVMLRSWSVTSPDSIEQFLTTGLAWAPLSEDEAGRMASSDVRLRLVGDWDCRLRLFSRVVGVVEIPRPALFAGILRDFGVVLPRTEVEFDRVVSPSGAETNSWVTGLLPHLFWLVNPECSASPHSLLRYVDASPIREQEAAGAFWESMSDARCGATILETLDVSQQAEDVPEEVDKW